MRPQQAEQTPISAIMHPHPHYVTEQQLVRDLVSLFLEQGISAVPVVDDNGMPLGLVSKTDVVRTIKGARAVKDTESANQIQPWWDADRLSQLKVGDIMTPTLYTFLPTTTVADATAAMAFEGIHHLPVVADSGNLVGMLSALDVLDWIARQAGYRPDEGQHGQVFKRPSPSMTPSPH